VYATLFRFRVRRAGGNGITVRSQAGTAAAESIIFHMVAAGAAATPEGVAPRSG
jgi:hypothetical protein